MNIDKIVFSCSPYFAPFWNIQSKIWKTKFQIDPVCLYFSDTKEGMSEEYGEVILKQTNKDYGEESDVVQVTMSKFWHPTTEPDKVWIIGDIDLIPLQTEYFLNGYSRPVDGDYLHFNISGICQSMGVDFSVFMNKGSKTMGGVDICGNYHIATGKTYKEILFDGITIDDALRTIVFGDRYGLRDRSMGNLHKFFWCGEENYTSEKIWLAAKENRIRLSGKQYHNIMNRIDRAFWNGAESRYFHPAFEINEVVFARKQVIDIHCQRPYDVQEPHLMKILKMANMI